MSNVGRKGRSFRPIRRSDLKRLLQIAVCDRKQCFLEHPGWAKVYRKRVLGVALCQGAALHHVFGKEGINDFDVYTLYRADPRRRWYAKRIKSYDLGNPRFGRSVDRPEFVGRRVDCLGRAIDIPPGEDIIKVLRRYLMQGKTKTARLLAKKAVVLLNPHCGKVVWTPPRRC